MKRTRGRLVLGFVWYFGLQRKNNKVFGGDFVVFYCLDLEFATTKVVVLI